MAELDVQPKKKSPWWIWLIVALIIIVLAFLVRGCSDNKSAAISSIDSTVAVEASTVPDWDHVNFDSPNASFEEITDSAVSVRGNDSYTIYGLGENVLFASGKSVVQGQAEMQLNQISRSLEKRFKDSPIAIYGNTDDIGDAGQNKALGQERAEAVKQWLVKNAGITAQHITVRSRGQSDPVASNATEDGRKMNRRVEIVVMKQK